MELLERKRLLSRVENIGTGKTFIWKSEPWVVISETSILIDSTNCCSCFNLFNSALEDFKNGLLVEQIKLSLVEV